MDKVFRTKTGFCHLLPDKLVLTRDGTIGNVAKEVVGNGLFRILAIYGVLALGFLYVAFECYRKGQLPMAVFFGVLGIYITYGIIKSRNNSATPEIARRKVQSTRFKKGWLGLTRSRFEVVFEDENGILKTRLILLPGSLRGGAAEAQKALALMRDEQWITP